MTESVIPENAMLGIAEDNPVIDRSENPHPGQLEEASDTIPALKVH